MALKKHLAVSATAGIGGTWTGTLCGFENAMSSDEGREDSTEHRDEVTCKICTKIIADPTHWRHRKYLTGAA